VVSLLGLTIVVVLLGTAILVARGNSRRSTNVGHRKSQAAGAKGVEKKSTRHTPAVKPVPEPKGGSTGFTLRMADGIQMEFVRVRQGRFTMGGELTGIERHTVNITRPFFLGKFEVTQEQWELVMGTNPSLSKRPQNPVNRVSWSDCQQFVERLNQRYHRPGQRFCLPTETQWEYACRANEDLSMYVATSGKSLLDDYAWHAGNAGNDLHPIGGKMPNAWGFHDMLGNVAEWCEDDPDLSLVNPYPPGNHVVRGGGYHDGDEKCNPEGRLVRRDVVPFRFDGLRVACVEEP
jgi:formylglycine-generating enzyme required for sulfatase activity